MARAARLAGPRRRTGPPTRLLAGLIAAAALAVAGCGSIAARSGPPGPAGKASGRALQASSARILSVGRGLCARPDAASRVIIARMIWPRPIRPIGPIGPIRPIRPVGPVGPVGPVRPIGPLTQGPPFRPGHPARQGHPVPAVRPGGRIAPGGSLPPLPTLPPGVRRLHGPWLMPRPIPARIITKAAQVHALARALCALPGAPRGPMSCPALFPGGLQLFFRADGRDLPIVTVQTTGCQMVTGLGVVRWAARSPAFWKLLASLALQPPLRFPGGPILVPGKWRPIGPGQAPCGSGGARRPGMSPRCPDPRATSVPHF